MAINYGRISKTVNKYWSSGPASKTATAQQLLQQQFNALAGGVTAHMGMNYGPTPWDATFPDTIEIDPSILAVTSERAERSIRIDFRQITCPCNHISLIRLEYSTDGHDTDDVKFTCPACGQEDKIHLVDIHPDGANIKIIETWQVGSDVKWDNKNVKQRVIHTRGIS